MRVPGVLSCQAAWVRSNAVLHAAAEPLVHESVPDGQSVGGRPSTGTATLGTFSDLEVGIWEMTPGVMRDVENAEIFVVLSGSATVEFTDGAAPLVLSGGDVVRFVAGTETVWTVTETLRKVYLCA